VKAFVQDDFRFYENVSFLEKDGEDPFMLFLNKDDQVVERVALEPMKRAEIHKLMQSKGMKKLENPGKKPKLPGWDELFDANGEYIDKDAPPPPSPGAGEL